MSAPAATCSVAGTATPAAASGDISFDSLGADASFEIFEFFAGLGGYHVSLPGGLAVHSITAVEIDRRAAECYEFNLHPTKQQPTAAPADSSASSTPLATPADSGMSAKARMKANRKIFFQKQKAAAEEAARAKVAESAQPASDHSQSASDLVPSATVAAAAASAAADSDAAAAVADAAPRRAIASTLISSFSIPTATTHDELIRSAQPPRLLLRLIEQLPPSALMSSSGRPSMWLMSPPCQPYTHCKNSKQLGSRDPRNAAFEWLMKTLRDMDHAQRPVFLALENVKHFFRSDMHAVFLDTLQACGYDVTQYMLSPMQIGVPNHRTRYYAAAQKMTQQQAQDRTPAEWLQMRARLVLDPPGYVATVEQQVAAKALVAEAEADTAADDASAESSGDTSSAARHTPTPTPTPTAASSSSFDEFTMDPMPSPSDLPVLVSPSPLRSYLDSEALPSPSLLLTAAQMGSFHLSVVAPEDCRTFCMTGAYGKVINTSSGSFLLFQGAQVDRAQSLTAHPLDKTHGWSPYVGSIRFFSPMELLRLFGFPVQYRFPPNFAVQHCYKLIGNSINVTVVQGLLRKHLARFCREPTPDAVHVRQR